MLFSFLHSHLSTDNFRKHIWTVLLLGFFTCAAALILTNWLFTQDVYLHGTAGVERHSFWELLTK